MGVFLLASVLTAAGLAWLVFRQVYATIESSFDARLRVVSSVAAATLDGPAHDEIADAMAERPGESVPPSLQQKNEAQRKLFRELRRETDLTYLYTFRLRDEDEIYYVFDGSVGENASFPGDRDTLPAGSGKLLREGLAEENAVFFEARRWEQWGLIKTAFFPLRERRGDPPEAFVGADMKVERIHQGAGAAALAAVIGSAIGIAGAVLLSVFAARRLVGPLKPLRDYVLQVAGGTLDESPPPFGIYELASTAAKVDAVRSEMSSRQEDVMEPRERIALPPSRMQGRPGEDPQEELALERLPDSEAKRLLEALQQTAPWKDLYFDQKMALLGLVERLQIQEGTVLLTQDRLPRGTYLLLLEGGEIQALGWRESLLNTPAAEDLALPTGISTVYLVTRTDWQHFASVAGGLIASLARADLETEEKR